MNRTMKKILSIVMVVMMFASAVPMSASAANVFEEWTQDYKCSQGNHATPREEVLTAATCGTVGVARVYCSNCSKLLETKVIPATGVHTPVNVPAVAATCLTKGLTAGTKCSVCEEILSGCEELNALGHDVQDVPAAEPTCDVNGLTAGRKCIRLGCDYVVTAQTEVAPLGHIWKTTKTVDSTCYEKGYILKECQRKGCNATEVTDIPEAHEFSAFKTTKAPSCTEDGIMAKTCAKCKQVIEENIPKLGHTAISVAEVPATCEKDGKKAGKICSVCEAVIEGCEPILSTGHKTAVKKGVAPTCTDKGIADGYYCSVCGEVFVEQTELAALGHDMVVDTTKSVAATCTKQGLEVKVCSRTGCNETTQTVTPITHNVEWKTIEAATCKAAGKAEGVCAVCKEKQTKVLEKLEHTVSATKWVVFEDATCTKDGVKVQQCSVCKETVKEAIPKLGHKEVVKAGYPATCQKAGLTDGKWCEYCGEETQKQEAIPLAAHTYGEWKVTKDPTCAAVGSKEATCKVCGKKTTEKIDNLPHTEKAIPAVAATCTTAGNEAGILCEKCGAIVKEALVIEALGHDWVDSGKSVAATCTTDGVDDYKCSRCPETKTGVVPATGHQNTETIPGTPADCTLSGVQDAIKCKDCGQWVQEQVEIPALGHDMVLVADKSIPATCEKEGVNFFDCSRCDVTEQTVAPKLEHAWGAWVVDVEATCNTKGEQHRECANCKLVEKEEIPNGGGCVIVSMPPVAATCTEKGYTGGTHCEKCKTVYTEQIEVAPLGHNYVDEVIKATVSAGGQITSECQNCGDVIIDTIDKIANVKLSSTAVTYNGKARYPSVIVTDESDELLVAGEDFDYEYSEEEMKDCGEYQVYVTFKGDYEGEKTLTFTIGAGKTSSIKTTATQKGTMKLTWSEVEGATGYRVYIYKTVDGKTRKRVASVEGTSYTLTKDYSGKALEMGAEYKIAVTAYTKLEDGTVIHAKAGVAKTFTQTPGKASLKATSTTKGKVNLSWTNLTGEDGYTVYYSTSKNGTYKKLTGTKANVVKFTSSLSSGKTYYFKVRAYAKADGETFRGLESSVVSVKVK